MHQVGYKRLFMHLNSVVPTTGLVVIFAGTGVATEIGWGFVEPIRLCLTGEMKDWETVGLVWVVKGSPLTSWGRWIDCASNGFGGKLVTI